MNSCCALLPIIKTYRKKLGRATFDTTEEYAAHLIKFLGHRHGLFSRKLQIEEAEARISFWFHVVRDKLHDRLSKKEESQAKTPQEGEVQDTTSEVILEELASCRKRKLIKGLPKNIRQILRRKLRSQIAALRRDVFKKLPMTTNASRNLATLAIEALTRHSFSPLMSGIVIAGFGEKEYTPAVVAAAKKNGTILDYKMLMHHTGDEYNVVTMTKFPSWASLESMAWGWWDETYKLIEPDKDKRKKKPKYKLL